MNVGNVLEILDDDKVTVTHKPVSSPSKASGPVVLAFFVLGLCATEKSRSSNCVLNGASSVRGISRIYGVYPVNLFSIY